MIRWKPPNLTRSHTVTPWQSRTEILKKHLESLSPEDLRQIRPDHYWLRFGQKAWMRGQSRKYDPDQPRVPAGTSGGGQWTSGMFADAGARNPMESFAAARRRGRSVAYCMTQYTVDGLMCNSVERARREPCWKQAAERLAACLGGRQVPPFNF